MILYEKQIKQILNLLEYQVDSNTDTDIVESLAKKHLLNEKKLSDLEIEIEKLLAQKNKIQDANGDIEEDILEIIGETKTQALRFGKILVNFTVTRETGTTKSSPQYKTIVEVLQKQYNIEQKIIDKFITEYNKGGKTFTTVNKSLSITKESKQLKESLANFFRSIWSGFQGIYKHYFNTYKNQNDYLEKFINKIN